MGCRCTNNTNKRNRHERNVKDNNKTPPTHDNNKTPIQKTH